MANSKAGQYEIRTRPKGWNSESLKWEELKGFLRADKTQEIANAQD